MYSTISPRKVPSIELSTATPPFLASLYEILTKEDPAVIGWCDGGKAFGVYDFEVMEHHVLPTYFRHSKFASFQRQLNYFGFRKLQRGRESELTNIYCQPLFTRDEPSRMLLIKRKTYRVKNRAHHRRQPHRPSSPCDISTFPNAPPSTHFAPIMTRTTSMPASISAPLHGAPSISRSQSAPLSHASSDDFDASLASVANNYYLPAMTHHNHSFVSLLQTNHVIPSVACHDEFECRPSIDVWRDIQLVMDHFNSSDDEDEGDDTVHPIPFHSECVQWRLHDDDLAMLSTLAIVLP
ncbi:Aste57867_2585 [Aphanomyces stellatus]|uniref:Aste57867_2585 protein n=1 Tax=Aphanomyces stellatus TaxID=120398 RepID=A0A485K7X6_9STRA|nr:hypothetical protein As57867_002578 [Aphanomyces stellatus]VFT79781.1 Aste57867_2585 [Aphanomyces stellatus]